MELFDCTSEDTFEPLFNMMETLLFKGNLLKSSSDDQSRRYILDYISRICKSVMRKLSVTHDTGFRGRVQILIANVFPLMHGSGLNRLGKINTQNETKFETLEEIKAEI